VHTPVREFHFIQLKRPKYLLNTTSYLYDVLFKISNVASVSDILLHSNCKFKKNAASCGEIKVEDAFAALQIKHDARCFTAIRSELLRN
jgi:hypothetical protein